MMQALGYCLETSTIVSDAGHIKKCTSTPFTHRYRHQGVLWSVNGGFWDSWTLSAHPFWVVHGNLTILDLLDLQFGMLESRLFSDLEICLFSGTGNENGEYDEDELDK
jgi:hypothetical protein